MNSEGLELLPLGTEEADLRPALESLDEAAEIVALSTRGTGLIAGFWAGFGFGADPRDVDRRSWWRFSLSAEEESFVDEASREGSLREAKSGGVTDLVGRSVAVVGAAAPCPPRRSLIRRVDMKAKR